MNNTIYLAGGCFWGVEFYFHKLEGVISTEVGYMGGVTKNPTYQEVCTGETAHAEVLKVVYDDSKTTSEELLKLFFEIHDFTQINRQGPDIGTQYRTAVFFTNPEQELAAKSLVAILTSKGFAVATKIQPAEEFYKAEDYHQQYYEKKNGEPYCHSRNPNLFK